MPIPKSRSLEERKILLRAHAVFMTDYNKQPTRQYLSASLRISTTVILCHSSRTKVHATQSSIVHMQQVADIITSRLIHAPLVPNSQSLCLISNINWWICYYLLHTPLHLSRILPRSAGTMNPFCTTYTVLNLRPIMPMYIQS